jgi:hypothetical protein
MEYLSLIKSSFHDIRCCDESISTGTSWRAVASSLVCALGTDGFNNGYVHVIELEEFTNSTGVLTGLTKPNLSSDPNFIADYLSLSTCALRGDGGITAGTLFARNYNSGILIITLSGIGGLPNYEFDCDPGASITQAITAGSYDIVLHVGQTGGLRVRMNVNDQSALVNTDENHLFAACATPINITTNPTM